MKTSKEIIEELMMYYRFADRTNQTVDEYINTLFQAYEQALKKEKEREPK